MLSRIVSAAWFALCLAVVTAGSAQAAVPVEEMSTGGSTLGDTVTPQPILPDELSPATSSPAAAPAVSGYPGYGDGGLPSNGLPSNGLPSNGLPSNGVSDEADTRSPGVAIQTAQPGQNAQLFFEMQELRSEILRLSGLVEDQAFQIKRLQDLQRSQYLDIDRRLTEQGRPPLNANDSAQASIAPAASVASSAASTATSADATNNEQSPADKPSANSADSPAGSPPPVQPVPQEQQAQTVATQRTEADAYAQAFELMKNQQFEQSIVAYQNVIEQFPGGSYAPESRYWLGELYLMANRLEDARGSFNEVIDQFPAHQKVPLSLYKLGVVNHRLGGTSEALVYLDDVVVRYPDTPAAGLARTYAAELR